MIFINTLLVLSVFCIVLNDISVDARPNRYILVPEDSPFLAGNNAKKDRRAGPPKFVLVREDSHLLYPSRGRDGRNAGESDEAPHQREYVERKPPPPQQSKSYGDDSPTDKEIILVPYQKTNVYRSRIEDEENPQQPNIFSGGQQINEEVTHVETNSQEPNVKYVTKLVTTSEKDPETEKEPESEKQLYYEQPEEEEEPEPNHEPELKTNKKPDLTIVVTDGPEPEVHALQRGYHNNKFRKQLHEDPYHHHQHLPHHHYHPHHHPAHVHRRRHLHQLLYHHPHTPHTHVPGGYGHRGGHPYHVTRQVYHYDSPYHPHFLRDARR